MKSGVKIIIAVSILLTFSCETAKDDEDTPLEHQTENMIHEIPEGDLEILEVEGCEYIVFKDSRGTNHGFGYMAHKGNCKNPIHLYNTEKILRDSTNK